MCLYAFTCMLFQYEVCGTYWTLSVIKRKYFIRNTRRKVLVRDNGSIEKTEYFDLKWFSTQSSLRRIKVV